MGEQRTDETANSRRFGEAAWRNIVHHQTSADPATYAVWYAFAQKSHPALSVALRERLATGRPSDGDLRDMHRRYLLDEVDGATVSSIAQQTQSELRSVIDALQAGNGDLGSRESELRSALVTVAKPDFSRSDLQTALSAILSAASGIAATNAGLTSRLRTSEQRIAGLETDLGAARRQTLTDGLTGLSNRRAFDEHMGELFPERDGPDGDAVLAMIDIDHFKAFNDKHGHPIGDQVIRFVASAMMDEFKPPAFTARYGGEEFAVVLRTSGEGRPIDALEEFRRRVARYDLVQRGTNLQIGRVSVSIGGASLRADDDAASLVARADEALYASKKGGRNRVTFLG